MTNISYSLQRLTVGYSFMKETHGRLAIHNN